MAAAAPTKLPAVRLSPSTLQYYVPKKVGGARPIYKRRFYPSDEAKYTLSQPWLARTDPLMPPYPYGKNTFFEEADHGLYGGSTIQSGNKISDGRNKGKTLRKWYPNVRVEKLRSKALNVEMAIPTTARVMRTIEKCGGLDEYLLGEKPARIKSLGLLGWKLRWLVLKSHAVRTQHARERAKLDLPEGAINSYSIESTFSATWADPTARYDLLAKMAGGWAELKAKKERFEKHFKDKLGWKEDIKPIKTLDVHDPTKMNLPETVEEEAPARELPKVQEGFGILEFKNEKGQFKGIEEKESKAQSKVSKSQTKGLKARSRGLKPQTKELKPLTKPQLAAQKRRAKKAAKEQEEKAARPKSEKRQHTKRLISTD